MEWWDYGFCSCWESCWTLQYSSILKFENETPHPHTTVFTHKISSSRIARNNKQGPGKWCEGISLQWGETHGTPISWDNCSQWVRQKLASIIASVCQIDSQVGCLKDNNVNLLLAYSSLLDYTSMKSGSFNQRHTTCGGGRHHQNSTNENLIKKDGRAHRL